MRELGCCFESYAAFDSSERGVGVVSAECRVVAVIHPGEPRRALSRRSSVSLVMGIFLFFAS